MPHLVQEQQHRDDLCLFPDNDPDPEDGFFGDNQRVDHELMDFFHYMYKFPIANTIVYGSSDLVKPGLDQHKQKLDDNSYPEDDDLDLNDDDSDPEDLFDIVEPSLDQHKQVLDNDSDLEDNDLDPDDDDPNLENGLFDDDQRVDHELMR
ncbi:hypothetical protein ACE6H2_021766 [Prunus campanulata]